MITCKEDLMNTYIINDKGALRDAYLGKLKELGFEWCLNSRKPTQDHLDAFEILVNKSGDIDWNGRVTTRMSTRKELTLSDFKPTRTEYVKVEDSIFDLKGEFEAGELYHEILGSSELVVIDDEPGLIYELQHGNVYRKVEREITWQDELRNAINRGSSIGEGSVRVGDSDLTDEQFIEMCHKVYHLTR